MKKYSKLVKKGALVQEGKFHSIKFYNGNNWFDALCQLKIYKNNFIICNEQNIFDNKLFYVLIIAHILEVYKHD